MAVGEPTGSPPLPPSQSLSLRLIYRDSQGDIHFDWQSERIGEAVADEKGTLWVDILDHETNADGEAERFLLDVFKFHPLAVEDAVKETHISKVDDWGSYLYIVFHSLDFDPGNDHVRLHELDIFLGKNYVVTYHGEPLEFLEQDRRNIERDPKNRLRNGTAHLLYHFLDMAVAEYLPAIEHLDEAIDQAQEEVFKSPSPKTLQSIFQVKRSALRLHRILGPEREVLNRLARDSYDPIPAEHRVYFRDVYDHIVRVHDVAETLRDLISGALDTYLSAISNRTNDIMRTLTFVTVMFLPMTFMTGFFGMNFFGETLSILSPLPKRAIFFGTCFVMASVSLFQYIWAKKRGWI